MTHQYAYATNLSGMFEHLNLLNERRENDSEFDLAYESNHHLIDLEIIEEQENDQTGMNDLGNDETCENVP